ncbi:hypothetical protein GJAV_G00036780 [Gymnothorax javanicus]|nr:hypothetical protein GJAV_G00036780 [Gymnothorax javanicus]
MIADRLNATNMTGEKRTWQQVKIKSKNILQTAVKKAHASGTGGGPPTAEFTPAEELALDLNRGRPILEGIPGGITTDSVPPSETAPFIQVSGNTITLLELPEDTLDPGEGTSAVDDEETVSVDSRRLEDPDATLPESQPGNVAGDVVEDCAGSNNVTGSVWGDSQVVKALKPSEELDFLLTSESQVVFTVSGGEARPSGAYPEVRC